MSHDLNPVLQVLQRLHTPVPIFVRDDDAGWDDDRLFALLDTMGAAGVPIDLAAIPMAMHDRLAGALCARHDAAHGLLGLHQHGHAHTNHQREGRACEFGPDRPAAQRRQDLADGRARLQDLLGHRLEPVFTPPWNRCTPDTAAQLRALGFAALSRDRTAPAQTDLPELAVDVDWTRHHRAGGPAAVAAAWAEALGARAADGRPMGLMLHHAVMEAGERDVLAEWLAVLAGHPMLQWRPMRALLPDAGTAARAVDRLPGTPVTRAAPRPPVRRAGSALWVIGLALALGLPARDARAQAQGPSAAQAAAPAGRVALALNLQPSGPGQAAVAGARPASVPAAAAGASAPNGEAAARQGLRADDRRRPDPFTVNVLGQPVALTGSWQASREQRTNFDVNRARARDRLVLENEVKVEARARPTASTEVFVQLKGLTDRRHTQGSGPTREQWLERGQTWVRATRLGGTPWAVQVGRVALIERRGWWWDDDLDAVRLLYEGADWRLDTGLANEVAREASTQRRIAANLRGVQRWFGQATWNQVLGQRLDLFWLATLDRSGRAQPGLAVALEDDTDPSDLNARWLGLRASGNWQGAGGVRLAYTADAVLLRGREAVTAFNEAADGRFVAGDTQARRVRGHAVDLLATMTLPVALRPSLTLGLARGSGGTRDASLDDNFRQTGLQENKTRLGGAKRLRRYGELLQPELSNLEVRTLGAGLRVLSGSSVELMAHDYRQLVPSTVLPGSRLSTDPAGLSTDIGREVDLVLALREWPLVEFSLVLAHFRPGSAFAPNRRDPAQSVELGMTLNF